MTFGHNECVRSAAIIANCQRDAAVQCALDLLAFLAAHGVSTRPGRDLARVLGDGAGWDESELGPVDLLIAVGGDGTLLAANRAAASHNTPILGVHAGGPASFGFLTETTPANAPAMLQRVLDDRYAIETRLMVSGEVIRKGSSAGCFHALNELVIRAQSRMARIRVEVLSRGEATAIGTYAADGIIVATPTGSTAYNLAAGGPLVHPSVETILLTPICPHTLYVRSLLVAIEDEIHVRLESGERDLTLLTVDGQVNHPLEQDDQIVFRKSAQQGRFISLDGPNFYEKVQSRLRLGERFGH